jgi:hypothetical protein
MQLARLGLILALSPLATGQLLPKEVKLRFDGLAEDDQLGYAVADIGDVDADGVPDFAIGAPRTHALYAEAAGWTYVHSGRTGRLLHTVHGATGLHSGAALDGVGDINGDGRPDYVIGARNTSPPAIEHTGTVSVHSGATGALLLKWDAHAKETLGMAVAGVGDLDGDGIPDVVVAAPWSPAFLWAEGAAFAYSGATGALIFDVLGQQPFGGMGTSVTGVGDVDGDGHDDVVIGEPWGLPGGRVYVYSGATHGLLLELDGNDFACEQLGDAVADAGDIDGDGSSDLILGAPDTYIVPGPHGRVVVYSVVLRQVLLILDADFDDSFGAAVDGAGDVDGDGTPDLVIGSPLADPNGKEEAGRVRVHSGKTGALLFSVNGKRPFDHLGASVSGLGDIDGDGRAEVLIGVPDSDFAGQDAGSVLVVGPQ